VDLRLPPQHVQADAKTQLGHRSGNWQGTARGFVFSVFSQVVVFSCKWNVLTPLNPGGRK